MSGDRLGDEWGRPLPPQQPTGRCDDCGMHPDDLVNGLVLCACSVGVGASAEHCHCPWGRKERHKNQSGETTQPPQCHHTESGERPGAAGAGRQQQPKPPVDRESTAPQ